MQHFRRSSLAVHPHTRGDIRPASGYYAPGPGSPPHAWGHFLQIARHGFVIRFTPTRVGTFPNRDKNLRRWPVHPHTRGDIDREGESGKLNPGSPPHAWGHYPAHSHRALSHRFTPTRVGTLIRHRPRSLSSPVHPHTRGDIQVNITSAGPSIGSPPHAWGHYLDMAKNSKRTRFTPTRVGTFPA